MKFPRYLTVFLQIIIVAVTTSQLFREVKGEAFFEVVLSNDWSFHDLV